VYEYLLENLISYSQVERNLRRTADRGLVSELYRKQMNALALKYFGVDKDGNYTENKDEIVSYRCPYSGELIKDLSTAHLEHILPVSSNGGTVLFNCIPILNKANLSKKDEPNLLTWWQGKGNKYFSYDRLERLVRYMLEAYTLAFKEPNDEELYDYDSSFVSDEYIENDDLSIDLRSKSNKIKNSNQNITYYQLLTDMINELSNNIDVSQYNTKLNDIKEQNIFGNIHEMEKVIKAVQTVFKEVLGDDSKKYLSYSLKIDMNKLFQSLDTTNYEQEIRKRFECIQLIIKQNNIVVNNFFENLQDIDDINLIYFNINKITEEQKDRFIENIKIRYNKKIMIFINMLKMANSEEEISELLKNKTSKPFTTYKQNENGEWIVDKEYGEIGFFYHGNKIKINSILNQIIEHDIELKEKLDDYYMNTLNGQKSKEGNNRRTKIFINMLKIAKSEEEISELFKTGSQKPFTTYKQNENGEWIVDKEYGEIGFFYRNNSSVLKQIIEQDIELREKLDNYYINTFSGQKSKEGNNRRIEIFINMLKITKSEEEISELFKTGSQKPFTTYKQNEYGEWIVDKEYGKIGTFWGYHKDAINTILKQIIEQDIELREKLDNYYMNSFNGQITEEGKQRRIDIFIDMLRRTKSEEEISELFNQKSSKPFTTYKQNENGEWIIDKEYGEIGAFFHNNSLVLSQIIEQEVELKEKLDNYYMNTFSGQLTEGGKQRRIDIFIDMLRRTKSKEEISELFKTGSPKPFTTYKQNENGEWIIDKEYGKIGTFWGHNKVKTIIPQLFFSTKYSGKEYNIARHNLMNYLNSQRRKKNQPEFKSIEEYIDTLDKTKKETKALIELRDSLVSKKEQLLMENQSLTEALNTSVRRAM